MPRPVYRRVRGIADKDRSLRAERREIAPFRAHFHPSNLPTMVAKRSAPFGTKVII